MDLGGLLDSPQGSQSSSRVGACTCSFLPSCISSVRLPFTWIKGSVSFPRVFPTRLSHEAFPRGFATWLSHVPQWCESILGLKVESVRGNRFPWNGLRHLGDSENGGMSLEFLSPFLWRAILLRCDENAGNSFPTSKGKDPSSRAMRRKRGSSGCGRNYRASS